MGLFNFWRTKQSSFTEQGNGDDSHHETADIPRDVFIEDKEPLEETTMHQNNGVAKGIEIVYTFLEKDFESKGYNDAMASIDDINRSNGIKSIKYDLEMVIIRADDYYENKILECDLQIKSAERAGFITLVDKFKSIREKAIKDVEKLNKITSDMKSETGMVERLILSYQKGYMRGYSAIIQSKIPL